MARLEDDFDPRLLKRLNSQGGGTRNLRSNRKDWYTRIMVTIGASVLIWLFFGGPMGLGKAMASKGKVKAPVDSTKVSKKQESTPTKKKILAPNTASEEEVSPP